MADWSRRRSLLRPVLHRQTVHDRLHLRRLRGALLPSGQHQVTNARFKRGTGITPDIYLPMDVDTWKATGKDNPLERALQLIGGRKLYSAGYQQYPRINLPFFR